MKVLPFKIQKETRSSIMLQHDKGLAFYERLHQHPEIQLSYILKGSGTFIIGDALGVFKPGDIFLIGENLPHVFKISPENTSAVYMQSVFFTNKSFGASFFDLPELKAVNNIINLSDMGLQFTFTNDEIYKLFKDLSDKPQLDNILIFLKILKQLSLRSHRVLASVKLKKIASEFQGKRLDAVYQYVLTHFNTPIKLEEVADISALSKPAFCKYFKQHTNKTFITFLNELRIGEASRQLQQSNDPIQTIAYRCGFNNLTNFNRTFKTFKGMNPSNFRKQLHFEVVS